MPCEMRMSQGATRQDMSFAGWGGPWPWRCLLMAALLTSLAVLLWKLNGPLTDRHSFRQTQTALTAFWLPEHWAILRYQTPVLGAPWPIPFEFPLYQLLAALLSCAGLPLEVGGRCVSWLAMAGTLLPMRFVLRRLFGDDRCFCFCAPLYLLSPIVLFWGRTFLIETLAVFLLAMFVQHAMRALEVPRWQDVAAAGAFAALGLLTKVTTGPSFYVAVGLLAVRQLRRDGWNRTWRLALSLGCAMLIALGGALLWIHFSDQVKAENLLGEALTSANLREWNFGTLAQRLELSRWDDILARAGTDILGRPAWVALLPLLGALASPRCRWASLWAYGLFFLPILLFFNLHFVHDYYQTANAVFIILAGGIAFYGLVDRGRKVIGILLFSLQILSMALTFFDGKYANSMRNPPLRAVHVGAYLRENTRVGTAIVIFGNDWNSDMPYYAQRKSLSIPEILLPRVEQVPDIRDLLGGNPLSAVVICSDAPWRAVEENAVRHIENPVTTLVDGCAVIVGASTTQTQ